MNTLERATMGDAMLIDDSTDIEDIPRTSDHSEAMLVDLHCHDFFGDRGSNDFDLVWRDAYPSGTLVDFPLLDSPAGNGSLSAGGSVTELMHCEADPFFLATQGFRPSRRTLEVNVDIDMTQVLADGEMEPNIRSSLQENAPARLQGHSANATHSDGLDLTSAEHSTAASASPSLYPPSLRCVPCNKTFTARKSLWRHQRSVHKQAVGRVPANGANDCPQCHRSFARKDLLGRHIRYQHSSAKMPCPICGSLVAPRSLSEHEGGQRCLEVWFRERFSTKTAASAGGFYRFHPVPGPSSFWKTMDPLSLAAVLTFSQEELELTPFFGGRQDKWLIAWRISDKVPQTDVFAAQSLATIAVRSSLHRDPRGDLSLVKWIWLLVALSRLLSHEREADLHECALEAASHNVLYSGFDQASKWRFKIPAFSTLLDFGIYSISAASERSGGMQRMLIKKHLRSRRATVVTGNLPIPVYYESN